MWYLCGFVARSDVRLNKFSSLPIMVYYFENTEDLVFDRNLSLDINLKKKVVRNYKLAAPHTYMNTLV